MLRRSTFAALIVYLVSFHSFGAYAFEYEVLFEDSIGRDAVKLGRAALFTSQAKFVLLDAKTSSSGTGTTSYDRTLLSSLRGVYQRPLVANTSVRAALPLVIQYRKETGEGASSLTTESDWLEAKPKIELVYGTQNALDIVLGYSFYYTGAFTRETEGPTFNAKDSFKSALLSYPQIALVKRAGNFDGGFSFKFSGEKGRKVTKENDLEAAKSEVEDRVFDPTTVSIFVQSRIANAQVFGEFSAVEASGGGNRTDTGATTLEDYFRVQIAGLMPLQGKALQLESILMYKNLSYADSKNIAIQTIPMGSLQLRLLMDSGLPLYAGLIGVSGSDGQSLPELNASYKIFGVGAVLGLQSQF